jgi:hypothetical protein
MSPGSLAGGVELLAPANCGALKIRLANMAYEIGVINLLSMA